MTGTSSSDSTKRKRSDNEMPSITIPASKRQKSSQGMSIKIKRKSVGRDASGIVATSAPSHLVGSSASASASNAAASSRVGEFGTKMWTAVRAARSKEGLEVAHDFLKLPPKRQYPDYYVHVKHPICLDDIKGRLDSNVYPTLQAVKDDLDMCFNNATSYNMEHSPIWESAKLMQRIANKEFKTLLAQLRAEDEDVEIDGEAEQPAAGPSSGFNENQGGESDGSGEEDDEQDGEGDEEDEDDYDEKKPTGGKRIARTALTGLLNTRLQRFLTKSAKSGGGNELIEPFLVLPNRKDWPQYYATIEKPIAFDTIQRKLKKKSYKSSNEFGADVELLFDNALKFNEDNSPVWIAAQTLRPIFHKLMADLPAEHAYTRPVAAPAVIRPRIKIKVNGRGRVEAKPTPPLVSVPLPEPVSTSAPVQPPPASPPSTSTAKPKAPLPIATPATKPLIRNQNVPVTTSATPAPAVRRPPPPPPPSYATPVNRTTAVPSPGLPRPGVAPLNNAATKPAYGQTPNYSQLRPPPITYQQPQSMVSLVTSGIATPPIAPRSPSPEIAPLITIQHVGLTATPAKRLIQLKGTPWGSEDAAPVRCFAIRLGRNETGLRLSIQAERPNESEEDQEENGIEVDEKNKSEPGVMIGGRKFAVEVKCNGAAVSPVVRKQTTSSALSGARDQNRENGATDDEDEAGSSLPKMNGHAATGSDDESLESENDGSKPALRSTRSGKVIPPFAQNGKLKRRRKSKQGSISSSRDVIDLGQWDVTLSVGSNVLDLRVGGSNGESWRVFVDRVF